MAKHEKQKHADHAKYSLHPAVIALLIAAVLLAGVYGAGFWYFSSHFLAQTTLNGNDVSYMSTEAVADELTAEIATHSLTVSGLGVDQKLSAEDVGLSVDAQEFAAAALAELEAWKWPYEIFQTHDLSCAYTLSVDGSKVGSVAVEIVSRQLAEAPEAGLEEISYDPESGRITLATDYSRYYLDADAIAKAISEAFLSEANSLELSEDFLSGENPFSGFIAEANSYLAATCILSVNGETAFEITPDLIYSWLVFGDDLSITLDRDAIALWCDENVAAGLNTVGTSRTYTRPDGKVCTVSDSSERSIYGWEVDTEGLASNLADAISAREASSFEVTVISSAAQVSVGGQDWPNRYIDVDISEQHARFYNENSELIWEADIVTGQPNTGHSTPTGVWTVTSREYSYNGIRLRGPYDPETGTYEWDSLVSYWMGVIGGSVGFHDARNWRSSYGGSIYTYNGSHGCINMSFDNAAALYELIEVGDVVVIHN